MSNKKVVVANMETNEEEKTDVILTNNEDKGEGETVAQAPTKEGRGEAEAVKGDVFRSAIIAFKLSGGIIFAADSRGSRKDKILTNDGLKIELVAKFYYCMTGNFKLHQDVIYEIRSKSGIRTRSALSILEAVRITSELFKEHASKRAEALIIGYNKKDPEIFYINHEGNVVRNERIQCIGYGGCHAKKVLEDELKNDMIVEEGMKLAEKAMQLACVSDWHVGGKIRLFYLKRTTEHLDMSLSDEDAHRARQKMKEQWDSMYPELRDLAVVAGIPPTPLPSK